MNKSNYLLPLLMIAFSTLVLNAQENKADKFIANYVNTYAGIQDMKASVMFSVKDSGLENETSVNQIGTIAISGEKYKFVTEKQHTYCDGTAIWMISLEKKEVLILGLYPDDPHIIGPHSFEGYTKSTYDGHTGDLAKISLSGYNRKSNFKLVELYISESTHFLQEVVFHNDLGDTFSYSYTNIETNTGLPDTTFVPELNKEYKDFSIEDLR